MGERFQCNILIFQCALYVLCTHLYIYTWFKKIPRFVDEMQLLDCINKTAIWYAVSQGSQTSWLIVTNKSSHMACVLMLCIMSYLREMCTFTLTLETAAHHILKYLDKLKSLLRSKINDHINITDNRKIIKYGYRRNQFLASSVIID